MKGHIISMNYIGCHLSASNGYLEMVKNAIYIGANTFAFFTRNPRGGAAKEINKEDVEKANALMKENNFGKLVAHAPYTLNPCSADPKVREFAYMAMKDDLLRMEYTPNNYYNFHPGSHVGQGIDKGIEMISSLLNSILTEDMTTTVLLETMAGKGSEVGSKFEEINEIIKRVELKDKVGVCMDTCHVHDSGYDIIDNLDNVLSEFDRIVGMDKLKALHINDSKNVMGAKKDRHELIGKGNIGLDAIISVLSNEKLKGLPAILETPQDSLEGYKEEIALLRGRL